MEAYPSEDLYDHGQHKKFVMRKEKVGPDYDAEFTTSSGCKTALDPGRAVP